MLFDPLGNGGEVDPMLGVECTTLVPSDPFTFSEHRSVFAGLIVRRSRQIGLEPGKKSGTDHDF